MADDKKPLDGVAKWIGGIAAVVVAVVGLKAAVQQLLPAQQARSPAAQLAGRLIEGAPADYVLPGSDRRRLAEADLIGLSSVQLGLARNEIYARHGWRFRTADLAAYFATKSWYRPAADNDAVHLTALESDNVTLISRIEKEKCG